MWGEGGGHELINGVTRGLCGGMWCGHGEVWATSNIIHKMLFAMKFTKD